jgi:hypothetical protein
MLFIHSEVAAAMDDELVRFLERSLVKQEFDSLAGGHLAQFVLAFAPLLASTSFGKSIAPLQFSQFPVQIHAADYMLH